MVARVSRRRRHTPGDPRKAGGSIAGPGGPRDHSGVVIDTTNAVILDGAVVSLVEPHRDGVPGPPILAMSLTGRINQTDDRTEIVYLMDEDGAAGVVTELIALASRTGPEFLERIMVRLDNLRDDDAL